MKIMEIIMQEMIYAMIHEIIKDINFDDGDYQNAIDSIMETDVKYFVH